MRISTFIIFLFGGVFSFSSGIFADDEHEYVYGLGGQNLLTAAEKGDVEGVMRFLKDGIDVNYKPPGDTALCKAIEHNHSEVMAVLLLAKADVNKTCGDDSHPPVALASRLGNNHFVQVLLKAGAKVNAKDQQGRTALMRATQRRSDGPTLDTVRTLIEAGAEVNAKDNNGQTALMWAARQQDSVDIVHALLRAGAEVNAKDQEGRTALMIVAETPKRWNPIGDKLFDIVRALIEAGADVEAKDKDGRTAVMIAETTLQEEEKHIQELKGEYQKAKKQDEEREASRTRLIDEGRYFPQPPKASLVSYSQKSAEEKVKVLRELVVLLKNTRPSASPSGSIQEQRQPQQGSA